MSSEKAYLGFGGNLGNVCASFSASIKLLEQHPAFTHRRSSQLYRTTPWGIPDQPDFLNFVEEIEWSLQPEDLLNLVLSVERRLGRVREDQPRWGPRTLDIDLLLVGNREISTVRLILPHPHFSHRRFVLQPLCDMCPDLVPPGFSNSIEQLLQRLDSDEEMVPLGIWIEP